MQHLNADVLAAIRVINTGPDPDLHAPLEICIIPLDLMLEPHPKLLMFHMQMSPEPGDLIEYGGYTTKALADKCKLLSNSRTTVAGHLERWFDNLKLEPRKRIIPLAYDWVPDRIILERWLGRETFDRIFSPKHRDLHTCALFINDMMDVRCEPIRHAKTPFSYIAAMYKVDQLMKHTCASDCLTLAKTYKRMLQAGCE